MVISASRRCDIPAFGAEWFSQQLSRGEAEVASPWRAGRTRRVSLRRDDVDAFVFWTRDPRPFRRCLTALDAGGYPYVFLITLTGYPRVLEPLVPSAAEALRFFEELAGRIGRRRIAWRYDPLIFTPATGPAFHERNFAHLADRLAPFVSRAIVSFFDPYPKALRRLRQAGVDPAAVPGSPRQRAELLAFMAGVAGRLGLEIQTCAEPDPAGGPPAGACPPPAVAAGKCIDTELLNDLFGLQLTYRKDPAQRPLCRCQLSVDIGSYGSCRHGCLYCYAR